MPRKGLQKVRTGCRTCKLRKIKCDEARPHCARCCNTGRRCDGYRPPPPGSFSWDQLLSLRLPPAPETDPAELRSLSYFRHAAAPRLAATPDATFWSRHVPQVLTGEPAARHAVLAISLLYEHFDKTFADCPAVGGLGARRWRGSALALGHYNRAIRSVLTTEISDVETLLTVSLLFTCIELLQGNATAAIKHCRHGIQVHNSSPLQSDLSALFSHLSIFPFFFGSTIADFPPLRDAGASGDFAMQTFSQAREALDWIMARTVRLVRESGAYRLGCRTPEETSDEETPEERKQREIGQTLDAWSGEFTRLRLREASGPEHDAAFRNMEVRWLVSKIWTDACLDGSEMVYDSFHDRFERIVDIARSEKAARQASAATPSKFMFEMGFSPLLYLVVMKCRHLRLRLTALSLLRALSCARETLWDADILYALGARFIEIEHDIELPQVGDLESIDDASLPRTLPPPDRRIMDSLHDGEVDTAVDQHGNQVLRRRICLFFRDPGGYVRPTWDWITSRDS